jgi:hypothetical protein
VEIAKFEFGQIGRRSFFFNETKFANNLEKADVFCKSSLRSRRTILSPK